MKRVIDWLLLQTGGLWGLCCEGGWHSWRRYGAFEDEEDEDARRVYMKRECLWCEAAGSTATATREEAARYHAAQWRPLPPVERVVPATATTPAPVATRSPAKALPLVVRKQVATLRQTSRPDEVATIIMEQGATAGAGRTEPLRATDRDLATGAVEGLGPMKPAPDTNEA